MTRGGKREGSGRPKEIIKSHVVRVPSDVSKTDCEAIPSLKGILAYWRAECEAATPDSPRHHFLKQCLDEIDSIGL